MQSDEMELYQEYRSRIDSSFSRARACIGWARAARNDSNKFREWIATSKVFRKAAANWRKRAKMLEGVING